MCVQGYLAYWDALRKRHPRLRTGSCASGGPRDDLETMRRAVPLIRSDYLFEPTSQQCHRHESTNVFHLQRLDPAAQYEVPDLDAGMPVTMSVQDLMQKRLTVAIKDKPGAAEIVYRLVKGKPGTG